MPLKSSAGSRQQLDTVPDLGLLQKEFSPFLHGRICRGNAAVFQQSSVTIFIAHSTTN